jgi:hypothetical protein
VSAGATGPAHYLTVATDQTDQATNVVPFSHRQAEGRAGRFSISSKKTNGVVGLAGPAPRTTLTDTNTGPNGLHGRVGPPAHNTTTKAELLCRAKAAIEAGEQSLQEAAEALALARHDFNATQREIAAAVGKSVAWVNRLLRWWDDGCRGTPFGPSAKASRERRKRVQATEQQTRRMPNGDGAEDDETPATSNAAATTTDYLADFIGAVDTLFVKLSWDDQCKVFAYLKKKMKPPRCAHGT